MTIFYLNGFYDDRFSDVPESAVEISDELYLQLLDGQAQGKQIVAGDDGLPVLVELEAETDLTARKAALLNQIANKTDQLKAHYLAGYSQAEIDSFYRQEQEARGELPTMLLDELLAGRDDMPDMATLKAKVIAKADTFAIIMGKTFAVKQNFEGHIERAATWEELEKISQEIERWQ